MRKALVIGMLCASILPTAAQRVLTLDSCRTLALQNNRQLQTARMRQDIAANTRKAARTAYLPKVDAIGGYELLSKEISLLNNDQKTALNNLGTTITTKLGATLPEMLTSMAQQGAITPQQAQAFGQIGAQQLPALAQSLNEAGSEIRKAFRTNNRNMFGAAIMLRQPIYMGGAITAANRMADINEQLII